MRQLSLARTHLSLLPSSSSTKPSGLCPEGSGGSLIDSAEWIRNSNGQWTTHCHTHSTVLVQTPCHSTELELQGIG